MAMTNLIPKKVPMSKPYQRTVHFQQRYGGTQFIDPGRECKSGIFLNGKNLVQEGERTLGFFHHQPIKCCRIAQYLGKDPKQSKEVVRRYVLIYSGSTNTSGTRERKTNLKKLQHTRT
jgi:hypothetical protein